jgi:hypothetical protein
MSIQINAPVQAGDVNRIQQTIILTTENRKVDGSGHAFSRHLISGNPLVLRARVECSRFN